MIIRDHVYYIIYILCILIENYFTNTYTRRENMTLSDQKEVINLKAYRTTRQNLLSRSFRSNHLLTYKCDYF